MKYLIFFFLIGISLSSCIGEQHQLATPYPIQITGKDYKWYILYPGKDGLLHTKDDISSQQNLNLPVNTQIQLILESADYLYFLELPEFQQMGMATTGQTHYIQFQTKETGQFRLRGSQMCAYTHENLLGKVYVYQPFWFSFWQNKI